MMGVEVARMLLGGQDDATLHLFFVDHELARNQKVIQSEAQLLRERFRCQQLDFKAELVFRMLIVRRRTNGRHRPKDVILAQILKDPMLAGEMRRLFHVRENVDGDAMVDANGNGALGALSILANLVASATL